MIHRLIERIRNWWASFGVMSDFDSLASFERYQESLPKTIRVDIHVYKDD
jgi:hypothetical protein